MPLRDFRSSDPSRKDGQEGILRTLRHGSALHMEAFNHLMLVIYSLGLFLAVRLSPVSRQRVEIFFCSRGKCLHLLNQAFPVSRDLGWMGMEWAEKILVARLRRITCHGGDIGSGS